MPLQNRVTPFGSLIATEARGTLTGNRGVIHDAERRIVRPFRLQRWIYCRLEFKGRHRVVMTPGRWTELFFLDEATAWAAGHRPCAECLTPRWREFRHLWNAERTCLAPEIDAQLHAERLGPRRAVLIDALPAGAFYARDGQAYRVESGRGVRQWTPHGYQPAQPVKGEVELLTPPSIVAVLQRGFSEVSGW